MPLTVAGAAAASGPKMSPTAFPFHIGTRAPMNQHERQWIRSTAMLSSALRKLRRYVGDRSARCGLHSDRAHASSARCAGRRRRARCERDCSGRAAPTCAHAPTEPEATPMTGICPCVHAKSRWLSRWLCPCSTSSAPRSASTRSSSARIAQSASRRRLSGQRRMMDQHDADQALAPRGCKNLGECCNLALPQLAGRDERRRRHRRVQSDKRDRAEAAHEGKARAARARYFAPHASLRM